jgi:hypothetical protein
MGNVFAHGFSPFLPSLGWWHMSVPMFSLCFLQYLQYIRQVDRPTW